MIGYWIQKHDYSSESVDESSLSDTLKAYSEFKWDLEIAKKQDDVEGKNCPPGIGITNGKSLRDKESFLLHICPFNEESIFFNFHSHQPGTFLGISLGLKPDVHYVEMFPRNRVNELIKYVYAGDFDAILSIE